jgi:phage terminase large subunit-like protein
VDTLPEDIEQVADIVEQVYQSGLLGMIGLDQIGIGGIVDELAERGIQNADGQQLIVGISQGYKLSGAIKTTERKLVDKTLKHAGQDLMTWAVGNARQEQRGNATLITKQASGTAKIDPLMATFNAVALMATNPTAKDPRSVYSAERGLILV